MAYEPTANSSMSERLRNFAEPLVIPKSFVERQLHDDKMLSYLSNTMTAAGTQRHDIQHQRILAPEYVQIRLGAQETINQQLQVILARRYLIDLLDCIMFLD